MSFWANKLNGTTPPSVPMPTRDLYGMYNPVTTQQALPVQNSIQQEYTPTARLKKGGYCPGCGSDKYMQHGNYAVACGECGYHPRFEQSGYGTPSLSSPNGKPATPARQSSDHQTMNGQLAVLNSGGGDHIK